MSLSRKIPIYKFRISCYKIFTDGEIEAISKCWGQSPSVIRCYSILFANNISKCRGLIPRLFSLQGLMRNKYGAATKMTKRKRKTTKIERELSIFVDESGDRAGLSRYYVLCLVFHDQSIDITKDISKYEEHLAQSNLPNIPFHSESLLNGRKDYELIDIKNRKKMLSAFATLVRHLPFKYAPFIYKRHELSDPDLLSAQMKRDISQFLFDHLSFFQQYGRVKLYYDNGQDIVKRALVDSLNFVLSTGVVQRRKTSMIDYRLEQVADYLCTIELASIKYTANENGGTYNKFFGGIGAFKKNCLKQARRKLM